MPRTSRDALCEYPDVYGGYFRIEMDDTTGHISCDMGRASDRGERGRAIRGVGMAIGRVSKRVSTEVADARVAYHTYYCTDLSRADEHKPR